MKPPRELVDLCLTTDLFKIPPTSQATWKLSIKPYGRLVKRCLSICQSESLNVLLQLYSLLVNWMYFRTRPAAQAVQLLWSLTSRVRCAAATATEHATPLKPYPTKQWYSYPSIITRTWTWVTRFTQVFTFFTLASCSSRTVIEIPFTDNVNVNWRWEITVSVLGEYIRQLKINLFTLLIISLLSFGSFYEMNSAVVEKTH